MKVKNKQIGLACLLAFAAACGGAPSRPGVSKKSENPVGANTEAGKGNTTLPVEAEAGGNGPLNLSCAPATVDPGAAPLHRLSALQYANTLRELFGDLKIDGLSGKSGSAFGIVPPEMAQADVEYYQATAAQIAAAAVKDKTRLNAIAPCTDANKRNCAKTFLTTFGTRAYRAPVSDAADIERHLGLYDVGAKTSYEHGIELLLKGILQSPRFLYHVEVGTSEKVGESAIKLSGYEVAARLSYAFWDRPPNEKLLGLAAGGQLANKEGVSAQIDWMLKDEKGQKALQRFLEGWIHLENLDGLSKDGNYYPEWKAELKAAIGEQARTFFADVLQNQGGKLSALLTSNKVFLRKDLAPIYGDNNEMAFKAVEKSDGSASGLLSLPAFLALNGKPAESSPIHRGIFVREALLCQHLPSPPADIPKAPDVNRNSSTRDRLAQHVSDPNCAVCHKLIDPLGLGFEAFDSIGRFRAMDGGKAVDTSGELKNTRDADGPFKGVAELGQKLAKSEDVSECVTRQWFRFALSRFEKQSDACSIQSVLETFKASGGDLNVLPKAVINSDAFLYRRPIKD